MIEHAETLQVFAEVSVTLAGFISVVLVFQRGAPAQERVGRNTILHLLFTSLGTLVMALTPLLLYPIFSADLVWRISFPILGLLHGAGATRALLETVRGEILVPGVISYGLVIGSYLVMGFSLAVGFGLYLQVAPAAYLLGLGWLLGVSIATFASMVLKGSA